MSSINVRSVEYSFIAENMEQIVRLSTAAFLKNHKITIEAYSKTDVAYREKFKELLDESTRDMLVQVHAHGGLFFVAEEDRKIVAISVGYPYGKKGLSDCFVESVFASPCCFKDVMIGWWNLMQKYEGLPPGKVFHQGVMAVDPLFAGSGIGAKIAVLTAQKIAESGFDGLAVETSSESADQLAAKLKKHFSFHDIDSSDSGLTLRLHLGNTATADAIYRWFLDKKRGSSSVGVMDPTQISSYGKHYHVGDIAVWDSDRSSTLPVVILLHPNSACRFVFKNQMEDSALTSKFRLISLDLPGHGDSKKATHPKDTYTFPGYAQAIKTAVASLGIQRCALLGWSLGGHVALEAMDQIPDVWAVALSGTPPVEVSPTGFQAAFQELSPDMMKLMMKGEFTDEEASSFSIPIGGESWMAHYAKIADGQARQRLGESILQGIGRDERELVASMSCPLAIISGDTDPVVNKDYMKTVRFNNLWGMHLIEQCGHGAIYEKSKQFNEILLRFLSDVRK